MCRRVAAIVLVIFLVPIVLFVAKFVYDNHRDNIEATQLLTKLSSLGLPPGAELKDEGSEVGNWVGSSDMLQMMAYRVFTCPLSESQINDFFHDQIKIHPMKGLEVDDLNVVAFDKTNLPTPDKIVADFKKASPSEQPNIYAIYFLDNPTGGFDIRGW